MYNLLIMHLVIINNAMAIWAKLVNFSVHKLCASTINIKTLNFALMASDSLLMKALRCNYTCRLTAQLHIQRYIWCCCISSIIRVFSTD